VSVAIKQQLAATRMRRRKLRPQQAEVTADAQSPHVVPALIADLGDEAVWRYVEFFMANIRNPNTRRAYLRACHRFLGWCEDRGLTLAAIRPHDVATYIEELQAVVDPDRDLARSARPGIGERRQAPMPLASRKIGKAGFSEPRAVLTARSCPISR
jgi:Phage integrase, N-terminal SAM-like domain